MVHAVMSYPDAIERQAFAEEFGRDTAKSIERVNALPDEQRIREATKLGYIVGQALSLFTPEEITAFRLGLYGAEVSPFGG